MKKVVCFLASLGILLFSCALWAEVPEEDRLYARELEKVFWYAKGGKVELKSGTWRFGATEKVLKIGKEEIVDADYTFFCVFTIVNNSTATYRINPSIMLLDYDRATVYRLPPAEYFGQGKEYEDYRRFYDKMRLFKPKVLKPGESYMFEDSFPVSRKMVTKVRDLKLELTLEEIK